MIQTLIDCDLSDALAEPLKQIGDVERVIARLALRSARPRDLTVLRSAFALLPELHNLIAEMPAQLVSKLRTEMGSYPELLELLEKAIIENPPVIIRDGGVICRRLQRRAGSMAQSCARCHGLSGKTGAA